MRSGRVALLGLSLALAGCASSSSGPAPDTAQAAAADAAARLEGEWVLLEFQPDAPLEPMLMTFLQAQMNHLRVKFHAGSMHIDGVGVTTDRSYRVTQAAADGFSLVIVDPTNVEYRVTGTFQGTALAFTSLSDPWRGRGRLKRAP